MVEPLNQLFRVLKRKSNSNRKARIDSFTIIDSQNVSNYEYPKDVLSKANLSAKTNKMYDNQDDLQLEEIEQFRKGAINLRPLQDTQSFDKLESTNYLNSMTMTLDYSKENINDISRNSIREEPMFDRNVPFLKRDLQILSRGLNRNKKQKEEIQKSLSKFKLTLNRN
ncbi:UNKNOWN [Stylonychia lemnae]|uniref:Uncharacterized protein n=1 Tax=Stylonychia lemnae TaxID=5949 RepID=A0A078A9J2_STYLE|nr:UNKNOWN [Stylonychia lemnae]|eukprot:CDW77463.1 UNKNOWN [Stylonychia lemnae]